MHFYYPYHIHEHHPLIETKEQNLINPENQQEVKKSKNQKSNVTIRFEEFEIGTISNSSGVFNSQTNIQFGWSSHSKSNTGFGSLGGQGNKVEQNTNIVFDNDLVDTPIDDRDIMWSQNYNT